MIEKSRKTQKYNAGGIFSPVCCHTYENKKLKFKWNRLLYVSQGFVQIPEKTSIELLFAHTQSVLTSTSNSK